MTLEQQDLAATTVEGEANQIRREIEAMQQVADALVPLSESQRTAVVEFVINRLAIYVDRDRI